MKAVKKENTDQAPVGFSLANETITLRVNEFYLYGPCGEQDRSYSVTLPPGEALTYIQEQERRRGQNFALVRNIESEPAAIDAVARAYLSTQRFEILAICLKHQAWEDVRYYLHNMDWALERNPKGVTESMRQRVAAAREMVLNVDLDATLNTLSARAESAKVCLRDASPSKREKLNVNWQVSICGIGSCVNDVIRMMRRHGHALNEAQLERIETVNRQLAGVTNFRVRLEEPEQHAA